MKHGGPARKNRVITADGDARMHWLVLQSYELLHSIPHVWDLTMISTKSFIWLGLRIKISFQCLGVLMHIASILTRYEVDDESTAAVLACHNRPEVLKSRPAVREGLVIWESH